jgi:hypothetical protein
VLDQAGVIVSRVRPKAQRDSQDLAKYGLVGTVPLRTAMVWWLLEIVAGLVTIVASVTGPSGLLIGAVVSVALLLSLGLYRVATARFAGHRWRRGHAVALLDCS